ncbi:MAG: glycosyltransferase family 1 protein, partial [Verrucomicrobiales bacterium]|nr:glycosyltransferase family 1 protein [Verrucomicrobiales bacterium]
FWNRYSGNSSELRIRRDSGAAAMKILTLSNSSLIESQGSGYVILNFANGIRSLGHDITLIGPDETVLLPGVGNARSLRLALGMWKSASDLAGKLNPDIIEFYGGEAWLATDRLSRRRGRTFRIVAHSNGIETFKAETLKRYKLPDTADGRPPKWYQGHLRLPVKKAFVKADAVVTVSQREADYVVDAGFQPSERVLAINNALSEQFLGQPFQNDRPRVIGFCGSWLKNKGIDLIVEDVTAVLRLERQWKLHLVGGGSEFRAETYFPRDVLPQVLVTSFVADKSELRRLYHSWAIALMPSIYESFGLVAAEALSCGCALIASNTGFPAELKHEAEFLLLPQPASPHLYNAILRLIRNEPLRVRIAQGGWRHVQKLRWNESVKSLESFYTEVLKMDPHLDR